MALGAGGRLGRLMQGRWPEAEWLARSDCNVLERNTLLTALRGADAVLCLAGVTSTSDRPVSLNVTLARLVLDAARDVGAGRVFLLSSAAVYGRRPGPLTEETPPDPLSEYAASKVAMEAMARAHPHPATTLRLGNVAGADAVLGGWREGFALDTLAGGGTPLRSYIGPGALARVMRDLAIQADLPQVLNVAQPGRIAMGALLDAAGLPWTQRPATRATLSEVTLDLSRLARHVPLDPATPDSLVADWRTTP